MSIHTGLWQRSDKAPVLNVIAIKDNEDEQVNDTQKKIVLIRPFLKVFFANVLLLMFSRLRWFHLILHPQRVWLQLTDFRQWTIVASLTLIARSGLGIFSAVRPSENWENWFLAKVPDSIPSLHGKTCFTCMNCLIFLTFCIKQELSTLLPNPLLSSAQRTYHSVLDAPSAGLVEPLVGISRVYLGHILGTSRAYLGHILGISCSYLGHILGISWVYLGHISGL